MKMSISAASLVGCVRNNNEDMILVGDQLVRNGEYQQILSIEASDRSLVALADGMGGHNSGEVASEDVLRNLQFVYGDMPSGLTPGDFNEVMMDWLSSINNTLTAKGIAEPQYRDMGTTLVALAYYAGEFYWMNCGDSRLYRLHGGVLQQLTTDHSLSNLIGESKHSSVITNCIGGGCETSYIDIVQFTSDVQPGDTFMLCSDGLTDMVEDRQLQDLLAGGGDARALCDAAIANGGFDNVSVCVIHIV